MQCPRAHPCEMMSRKNVFYDVCSSYLIEQLCRVLRANWNIPSEDEYFLNPFYPLTNGKFSGILLIYSVKKADHFQKAHQTSSNRSTIVEIEAKAGVSITTVS